MSATTKTAEDEQPTTSAKSDTVPGSSVGGDGDMKMDAEAEADLLAVEAIPEPALESVKRELIHEIAELEWEFKQIKEALFAERIAQVDRKLQQLRASEAPELLKVFELVDETYSIRKKLCLQLVKLHTHIRVSNYGCLVDVLKVAKHRRDFELEVANKEFDNALQMTTYDAEENLRTTEERVRLRIQEGICGIQVERAMAKRTRQTLKAHGVSGGGPPRDEPLRQQNAGLGHSHHHYHDHCSTSPSTTLKPSAEVAALLVPGLDDDEERETRRGEAEGMEEEDEAEGKGDDLTASVVLNPNYLPGVDLEPRRKPVALSPSFPRLVYELDEEDIRADIEAITNAIKVESTVLSM
ncbi:Breast cancer metastasis-suppressor 1-like protein [Echinococcus granulosus]|uniref:Breast cancer metastasis-suppressor 1-like protein n=1 Tax=Echinococcus granulosus TaxID=6210 RepID=W6UCV0_ECHGR|nr:Breast cancer metastasis-suppressor 1-like protein [Echinococcus granulosus]EUB59120.1 Breast cancer metastasis-suppressor 1-like protein [Echinococcus granulosus]